MSISEKEYYHLNISISKALNMMEAPLKLKHARSVIITTHRTKEAKSFWAIISTQPLMENRFTAWKFCHLLHKVLREGHHSAIKQSQSHKSMLIEMGKLWGHLQDGVGNCIQAYSKLLVTKLDFHDKNAYLPGSLSVPFLHIEKFAGDDINVYFQLGVEIFDYLEEIIAVQENVFRSVDAYRMSSMSPQGQCRLAPLITLIQDSNPLYDCCVRIMFKLHHNLPNDVLTGHRDRFREMFIKLKIFYDKVRPLQYFADLIQVPILPESSPNFTSKVDFGNYIPPVVTVPEPIEEPETVVEHLVDLSVAKDNNYGTREESMEYRETISNYEHAMRVKDTAFENLEQQFQSLKINFNTMEERYKQEIFELRNEIGHMHDELKLSNEARSKIESTKNNLEQQISSSLTQIQRASELEEKSKLYEEKFTKLKGMYAEMREEHIKLLRQNGEMKKQFNHEKQIIEDLKAELATMMEELQTLRDQSNIILNEKIELERNLEIKSNNIIELQKECNGLHEKINCMKKTEMGLKESAIELERTKAIESELKNSLSETKVLLNKKIQEQNENIAQLESNLNSKISYIAELKQNHEETMKSTTIEHNQMMEKLTKSLQNKQIDYEKLSDEMSAMADKLKNLQEIHNQLEMKTRSDLQLAMSERNASIESGKQAISNILDNIFRTTRSIIALNFNESGQQRFERSFQLLDEIQKLLTDFQLSYTVYYTNDSNEKLLQDLLMLCYKICMLRELCMLVYNTTTDIEKGQQIFDMLISLAEPIEQMFVGIQSHESNESMDERIVTLKLQFDQLKTLLRSLIKQLDSNAELGDIIESELAEMEKAIAEAAEKFVELLSRTRSKDDGIKLEVNEKILDACTNLMDCIQRLIKQSKILQDEIVSTGRGRISAKEFYKRNSEWTEGLISASKSVAKGANFLVEAANKSIGTDTGQNFEIIVAAQEIAACTAQLVISSKVKAPKNSDKLQELTKASRMVSQATGAVVGIVKDCNQRLENYTDVDIRKLTTSQAKKMEMDIHVKVLELEQALQMERLKLCAFRRNLYQNSEDKC